MNRIDTFDNSIRGALWLGHYDDGSVLSTDPHPVAVSTALKEPRPAEMDSNVYSSYLPDNQGGGDDDSTPSSLGLLPKNILASHDSLFNIDGFSAARGVDVDAEFGEDFGEPDAFDDSCGLNFSHNRDNVDFDDNFGVDENRQNEDEGDAVFNHEPKTPPKISGNKKSERDEQPLRNLQNDNENEEIGEENFENAAIPSKYLQNNTVLDDDTEEEQQPTFTGHRSLTKNNQSMSSTSKWPDAFGQASQAFNEFSSREFRHFDSKEGEKFLEEAEAVNKAENPFYQEENLNITRATSSWSGDLSGVCASHYSDFSSLAKKRSDSMGGSCVDNANRPTFGLAFASPRNRPVPLIANISGISETAKSSHEIGFALDSSSGRSTPGPSSSSCSPVKRGRIEVTKSCSKPPLPPASKNVDSPSMFQILKQDTDVGATSHLSDIGALNATADCALTTAELQQLIHDASCGANASALANLILSTTDMVWKRRPEVQKTPGEAVVGTETRQFSPSVSEISKARSPTQKASSKPSTITVNLSDRGPDIAVEPKKRVTSTMDGHDSRMSSGNFSVLKSPAKPEILTPQLWSNKRKLSFGFVDVKHTALQTLLLQNNSKSEILCVKICVGNGDPGFQILDLPKCSLMLHPNESYRLRVVFTPAAVQRYRNKISVRLSHRAYKFLIPMTGYGGTARVALEDVCSRKTGGRYEIRLPIGEAGTSRASFVLKNLSQIPAFAKIVSVPGFPLSSKIDIQPSKIVLQGGERMVVTVNVPINSDVAYGETSGRLCIFWGEETMRTLLRRLESESGRNIHIRGQLFTDAFSGERTEEASQDVVVCKEDARLFAVNLREDHIDLVTTQRWKDNSANYTFAPLAFDQSSMSSFRRETLNSPPEKGPQTPRQLLSITNAANSGSEKVLQTKNILTSGFVKMNPTRVKFADTAVDAWDSERVEFRNHSDVENTVNLQITANSPFYAKNTNVTIAPRKYVVVVIYFRPTKADSFVANLNVTVSNGQQFSIPLSGVGLTKS